MRDLLLPLLFHGLLVAAGGGVLRLAGARVPSAGVAIALVGLAYLLGLTVVFAVIGLALVVGIPFGLPLILGTAVLLALPLVPSVPGAVAPVRAAVAGLQAQGWRSAPLAIGVVLAGTFVYGIVANATVPLSEYDAWAIWTHKAHMMFFSDGLPVEIFTSPAFAFAHPDYPLTLPLWEAAHFRMLGRPDTSQVHVLMWLLLPAWVGGAVALAPRRAPRFVVVAVAGAAGVLVLRALGTAYADAPLGIVLALAVLALGRWLLEGERSDLVLGTILLGGAAQLKNEGVVGGLIVLVALALSLVVRSRGGGLRSVGVAAAAWAVAFVAPWKLWLVAHDIHSDLPLGKLLDPGYLADHVDRLGPTWRALAQNVASGGLLVVPVVAAAALAVLAGARLRAGGAREVDAARGAGRAQGFAAIVLLGYTASLVLVYWISPYAIDWHLATSADRVLVPLGMLSVSAILLLTGAPGDERPAVEPTSAPIAVPDR